MRFLIDASLPRAAATMLRDLGHDATDVRDIAMGSALDETIAAHAKDTSSALVTRDFDFADIRNYPPSAYSGIAVLQLAEHATAREVVELLESFARRDDLLVRLTGHLAIIDARRVRFRSR